MNYYKPEETPELSRWQIFKEKVGDVWYSLGELLGAFIFGLAPVLIWIGFWVLVTWLVLRIGDLA